MKLSVVERMLWETDLSKTGTVFLLECGGECEWLDYKVQLHLTHDKELCDFTRDALAMKNMGGGFILVGVEDKTWKLVGLKKPLPYDSKLLRDAVRKCAAIDLEILVVHHDLMVGGSKKLFALIHIRSSKKRKKRRVPTLAGKDFCPKEKWGIRRGDIYVRKVDSTEKVSSEAELADLLDAIEARADDEALRTSGYGSPFAVEDGLYRLLERSYTHFVGRMDSRQRVIDAVTGDPRIWIINVHGPGGVGKSSIVESVAYQFYRQRHFECIIHLSAKDTMLTGSGIERHHRSLYSVEDLMDNILRVVDEPTNISQEKKKELCTDILSAWETLLVLDNMETVSDGRILDYVRHLPTDTKAKVLLTSRQKTGGWEYAIPISELDARETTEFLKVKSGEMNVDFPLDSKTSQKVCDVSGGLPLAIQWIVGRYKLVGNVSGVLQEVQSKDSPVLEFSFRNIWERLSPDARAALAVVSIFDAHPTAQQMTIATEWRLERVEKAMTELTDVTLVTQQNRQTDCQLVHVSLPITLSFAKHQFSTMGDFEVACRRRMNKFNEQLELQASETHRFLSMFERFGIQTDTEKKAVILCRRGQSEFFSGNIDNAEQLFRQALDLAPLSASVYAFSAQFELARGSLGVALDLAKRACELADKRTGELTHTVLGLVYDKQHNRYDTVCAFKKAMEYAPDNPILQHQYGVALSRAGNTEEAVAVFTKLIEKEIVHTPYRETLLMAYKTRIINLRRLGKHEEASRDLENAKKIIEDNPHLRQQARHILELEED